MGLEALMNWGPEKMLIRCSKESQHPAVDPKTSGWASKRTRKTQHDGHMKWRSKYEVYVRSPAPSHMQTLKNPFEPCNKLRGKMLLKKSSCLFLHASVSIIESLWYGKWVYICVFLHESADDNTTMLPTKNKARRTLKSSSTKWNWKVRYGRPYIERKGKPSPHMGWS